MATIGNYAYVLKCRLAVASLRKVDDPLKLAHTVRHLGDAYYYAGRWSLAEPCYLEALSIYRRHENRRPLDLAYVLQCFLIIRPVCRCDRHTEPLATSLKIAFTLS